jgi:hypothetical protein
MSRILLMQSILGHMALLAEKYPKKAAAPVTLRCKRAVKLSLQGPGLTGPVGAHKPLRKAA